MMASSLSLPVPGYSLTGSGRSSPAPKYLTAERAMSPLFFYREVDPVKIDELATDTDGSSVSRLSL